MLPPVMVGAGADEPTPASALTLSAKLVSCSRPLLLFQLGGRSATAGLTTAGGRAPMVTVPRDLVCLDWRQPSPDVCVQTVVSTVSGTVSRLVKAVPGGPCAPTDPRTV